MASRETSRNRWFGRQITELLPNSRAPWAASIRPPLRRRDRHPPGCPRPVQGDPTQGRVPARRGFRTHTNGAPPQGRPHSLGVRARGRERLTRWSCSAARARLRCALADQARTVGGRPAVMSAPAALWTRLSRHASRNATAPSRSRCIRQPECASSCGFRLVKRAVGSGMESLALAGSPVSEHDADADADLSLMLAEIEWCREGGDQPLRHRDGTQRSVSVWMMTNSSPPRALRPYPRRTAARRRSATAWRRRSPTG